MRSGRSAGLALCVSFVAVSLGHLPAQRSVVPPGPASGGPAAPDVQTACAVDASRLWLVPGRTVNGAGVAAPLAGFSRGVKLFAEARYAEALPHVSAPALANTPLAHWAAYLSGQARLKLGQPAAARHIFAELRDRQPVGFISEAALIAEADAAAAFGDHESALRLYAEASDGKPAAPDDVLMRLAHSAQATGDAQRATQAYARVHAEFPLSDLAAAARAELERMAAWPPLATGSPRYRLELDRAERLFTARRYAEARSAFDALRPHATGDDAEVVALRIAECDYSSRRYAAARDRLRPLVAGASRLAEARFYYLSAIRGLGGHDNYERLTRELVNDFPDTWWAEEALNGLASHFIVIDDDAQADTVFRELLAKYPKGRHADRAAWKAGWWDYKHGRFEEAAAEFEAAASAYPRSDYRPPFLYWTARAYERLRNRAAADAAHLAVIASYGSSYYGRLSARRPGTPVTAPPPEIPPAILEAAADPGVPPAHELIRLLLSLELYDLALDELLFAQRTWGTSPMIDATLGWVHNRRGDLRPGITAIRRAYPQHLAAGGELLPVEIQRVIFPVDYWPLIQKHAAARKLDPFLMAALIAQESTFDAAIRSRANAIGLMQIMPATGRRYARQLGIRRYSTSMLTRPEINIQIGMAYFSDLSRRFGRVDFALAGYNAGENRIAQWRAERPGLDPDEFIDDVPFPETQHYLKKILGTAEDYRRIYGPATPPAALKPPATKPPAKPPVRKLPTS